MNSCSQDSQTLLSRSQLALLAKSIKKHQCISLNFAMSCLGIRPKPSEACHGSLVTDHLRSRTALRCPTTLCKIKAKLKRQSVTACRYLQIPADEGPRCSTLGSTQSISKASQGRPPSQSNKQNARCEVGQPSPMVWQSLASGSISHVKSTKTGCLLIVPRRGLRLNNLPAYGCASKVLMNSVR